MALLRTTTQFQNHDLSGSVNMTAVIDIVFLEFEERASCPRLQRSDPAGPPLQVLVEVTKPHCRTIAEFDQLPLNSAVASALVTDDRKVHRLGA